MHRGTIFVIGKDDETIEKARKELQGFETMISIEYEVKPYLFKKDPTSSFPSFLEGKAIEIVTPFGRFGRIDHVKEILTKNNEHKGNGLKKGRFKVTVICNDDATVEKMKKIISKFDGYFNISYEVNSRLVKETGEFITKTPWGDYETVENLKRILEEKSREVCGAPPIVYVTKFKEKIQEQLEWIKMKWEKKKEYWAKKIILELYKNGMIKTWFRDKKEGWTLKSGIWSPFYVQLRLLPSYPELLKLVGQAISEMINNECNGVNVIVGVAMAGIPIATAASLSGFGTTPMCYTRKLEGKTIDDVEKVISSYGGHSIMEGNLSDGDKVVILDDLVTKFDSKIIAIKQIEHEVKSRKLKDVTVKAIVVLVDREQGAGEVAEEKGCQLVSLIPFKSKGLEWLKDAMHPKEHEVITEYLENSEKYQDKKIQKKLEECAVENIS